MAQITPSGTFGFYVGPCLVRLVFCACCFPEIARLSLEEVKQVFIGIRWSRQVRQVKQVMRAGMVGVGGGKEGGRGQEKEKV